MTQAKSNGHGPQCEVCKRFFTPTPRSGDRQRCCGRARCRCEYKKRWRQKKYLSNEQFREKEKARVGRWRGRRRGSTRRDRLRGGDPGPVVVAQRAAEKMARLEQTLGGLVLHSTECSDREGLALMLRQFEARGREALAAGG